MEWVGIAIIAVILIGGLLFVFRKKKKGSQASQTRRDAAFYPIDMTNNILKYQYTTPAGVKIASAVEFTEDDRRWQFPVIEEALRVQIETAVREAAKRGQTYDKRLNLSEYHITIVKPTAEMPGGVAPLFHLKDGREAYGLCVGVGDAGTNYPEKRDSIVIPFHKKEQAENLFEIIANEAEHIILNSNTFHIKEWFPGTGYYFMEYTGENDRHPVFSNRPRWSGVPRALAARPREKKQHNCIN